MNAATLASAVVDLLNDPESGLSAIPAAVRALNPTATIEEIRGLEGRRVIVVPRQRTRERLTRGNWQMEQTLDVTVQRFVAQDDKAAEETATAAEIAYAEELEEYLCKAERQFVASGEARFVRSELGVPYLPTHLREFGIATVVVSVTYEFMQAA